MKYDPSVPLFYMHIPKCAGAVVRTIIRRWCKEMHLDDNIYERPPIPSGNGAVVSTHYDRGKDGAIEDVRPEAKQLTAVFRNPFDFAVSMYFYWKNAWHGMMAYGKHRDIELAKYGKNVGEFVMNCPFIYADFLPAGITPDGLNDFVLVGTINYLQEYINQLSIMLGKPNVDVWKGNPSTYDEEIPNDLRAEHARKHALDYALFARASEIVESRIAKGGAL